MRNKFHDIEPEDSDDESRPAKQLQPTLLHDETDFLVVSKPVGVFYEGGLFDDLSLVEFLAESHGEDTDQLVSIHPLDSDVSGLMLVAKNQPTAAALIEQFDSARLTLTCLAIVRGMLLNESGTIDKPVTLPKSGKVKVVAEHGHPARTEWRLRDKFVAFALLECIPRTRLEQQIRAHLHDMGTPLAVDPLHGGAEHLMLSSFKSGYRPSRRHGERPLISRPSLHAWKLEFSHPTSGSPISIECPPPKDFKATLHQLERFGRVGK